MEMDGRQLAHHQGYYMYAGYGNQFEEANQPSVNYDNYYDAYKLFEEETQQPAVSMITDHAWTVVRATLQLIAGMGAVLLNGLLLYTMYQLFTPDMHLSLRNGYRCLVSLAGMNCFSGLIILFSAATVIQPHLLGSKLVCVGYSVGVMWVHMSTTVMLLVFLVERYVALWYPLRYHHMLKPGRVFVFIAFVWIYSLAICSVPFSTYIWRNSCRLEDIHGRDFLWFVGVQYMLSVVISAIVYLSVTYELCTKKSYIEQLRAKKRNRHRYEERRNSDARIALAAVIISMFFVILWSPYFAVFSYNIIMPRTPLTSFLEELFITIGFFNPSVSVLALVVTVAKIRTKLAASSCGCKNSSGLAKRARMPNICLQSVSVRSHVTGSQLNLHTTINGRMVSIPKIVVTDYDKAEGKKHKSKKDQRKRGAKEKKSTKAKKVGSSNSIWCSPGSLDITDIDYKDFNQYDMVEAMKFEESRL